MSDQLKIIRYPDPRLKKISALVEQFDDALAQLAARMLGIMREHKGVGLAAPQVGRSVRLFVMNHTGEPGDDRVYVNPTLIDATGEEESEEGCLSLPGINANIARSKTITLCAYDLSGTKVEHTETGYIARIWQHEIDHLNGVLIIDRVGPGTKLMLRRALRELEEKYEAEHPPPKRQSRPTKLRARR